MKEVLTDMSVKTRLGCHYRKPRLHADTLC